MALMIMDWSFNLQAELALPKSYQITRSYYGLGSFEVKKSPRAPGADALIKDRIVFFSDALHKAAIIEKVVRKNGDTSASGKLLKGIAARRICVPPATNNGHFGWDRFIGSAEAAYHHYAAVNLYAPADDKRRIPLLVPGDIQDRGMVLPWQSRFGNLEALFADIGETGDKLILENDAARTGIRLLEVCESYAEGARKLRAIFGTAPVDFKADIMALKNQTVR